MDFRRLKHIFLICLCILPQTAFSGEFDGIKPLTSSVEKIIEINAFKIIDDVDPDTVGLPRNFVIDFKAKKLRPSKDSLVRKTSHIYRVKHIENKLILQGIDEGVENVDDGLAWSITISKKSGNVVISASGDGLAYVVFGKCDPVTNYKK